MQKLTIEELLNEMSSLNNELVNTHRDLKKKTSEIEILNFQLKKSNADLQQFASIVSHNLKAPVNNIVGISSLLKSDISIDEKEQFQVLLFEAVEQLNEQIEDLNKLLHAKSEINEVKEIIHFELLVKTIKSSINILLENEKVKINTNFSAIDTIVSNKNYIYSIFYNMISNSIKYKHANRAPNISIRTETDKKNIKIYFKDNGEGIDINKNGDKLFGLYNRFDLNKEGKGLGLFMVKSQIESLLGNITVNSKLDEGTEFIVELPL